MNIKPGDPALPEMNQAAVDDTLAKPRRPVEPLRQFGMGPTLLVVYALGLVMLQFVLVSLGTKPALRSC